MQDDPFHDLVPRETETGQPSTSDDRTSSEAASSTSPGFSETRGQQPVSRTSSQTGTQSSSHQFTVPDSNSYKMAESIAQAREQNGDANKGVPGTTTQPVQVPSAPPTSSSAPFARFMRRFALLVFVGLSIYSWWYMEDTRATNILNAVLGGFIMLWAFVYWYDFRNVHGSLRGNAFLFLIAVFLMGFVNLMMALITYFHNRASEVDVARITVTVMLVCTFIVAIVLWRKMSATTPK